MTVIRGTSIREVAVVDKASQNERDMYGGAVRLEVRWDEDGSSSMTSMDLDRVAVQELVDALNATLVESERDYESLRAAPR